VDWPYDTDRSFDSLPSCKEGYAIYKGNGQNLKHDQEPSSKLP